jgi:hypothetical protein
MELLSMWCRAAAFFSASSAALLQEVADGKIKVRSACTLNTQDIYISRNIVTCTVIYLLVTKLVA